MSILTIFIQSKDSFLFSVIIPIYNTGRFLNESLNSILNQTIGYENIQLILVNDGSSDETEKICRAYKKIYHENIFYIKINHSGVGKSRNVGLNLVKGKYLNFLDPDDIWETQVFELAYEFFEKNKNIDIIAGRMKFFEAREDFHCLDYKFKNKSYIANLLEEYDLIQLSVASCFFRYSSIKENKFNEFVITGEDTLCINSLLLKKPYIGYLNEIIYFIVLEIIN